MDKLNAKKYLKEYLKNYTESVTEKSKGQNMYVCPLCGSGHGPKATGAFSIKDGVTWKCFSCNAGGDIFDLIGLIEGITDYNEKLRRAGELYGIEIDGITNKNNLKKQNSPKCVNFQEFFGKAIKLIEKTDYPQKRGLNDEIIAMFGLGFVEHWQHPKAPNAPTSPRLIIPTGPNSYLARDTRDDIPKEQKPYSKVKVGSIEFFNRSALKEAKKPIFVVEGELDALSIIQVGGEAVALGTTAKVRAFIELLKTEKPSQPIIVALDNDQAGEKAANELLQGLTENNITCYRLNPAGEYKDANEALQHNPEALRIAVAEAENIHEEAENAKKESYLKTSAANYLQNFLDGISDSVNTQFIPTGFSNLDEILDGGLYEGLYIVGAISSLGKTTILIQIADQIAKSGQDVLFFSLEMSRSEIMAKSISRHTLEKALEYGIDTSNAKTSRGITTGSRYKNYSEVEHELINEAVKSYGQYAQNIYISEGVGNIGVEEIRNTIEKHINFTGKKPVVIIDYIQILAPFNERATDKQNTDKAVMELKRISRDFKIPVIGISSFNRANYKEAVTMEAFKESGAIEYSSDVLIGLQLKGAGQRDFNSNEAKQKNPREVEMVILKNRNGRAGDSISFNFYPLFNFFAPAESTPAGGMSRTKPE